MEQAKIQDFCEDYYWKQGLYYLEQRSALLGQFRLSSICQPWFRPPLIFPSALLPLNSGNLVALVMAAVSVADALEDISQGGLAFLGTLEPFAHCRECCRGHLCHGGYSTPFWPFNTSSGHNPTPNLSLPHPVRSVQGPRAQPLSLFAKPHHLPQLLRNEPQQAGSGMPIPFFCPTLPTRKSTAPKRSNRLQTARETRVSNKYFPFRNRT